MRPPVARLLVGYALASVAIGLPWPLLLVLVHAEYGEGPHGALLLGLTAAARMLPYVVLSWAVGSLGDRVPRDRLIRVTLLARVLLLALMALALAGDAVLLAVAAASLTVAVGTPAYPALAAAVPRLAGRDRRRATDVLVTIEVAAWVVGPALGGLLLLPATRGAVPLVACLLVLAALGLMHRIVVPGPAVEPTAEGGAIPAMLRAVAASRSVLGAMALAGLLNLLLATTAIALLPLTERVWGQGDTGFGIATAWLGFGALGAPLLWWPAGTGPTRRVRGLLALGSALLLVAVLPPPVALPLLAVGGAVGVLVEGSATQAIQEGVADEHRAGALGLADSVMVGAALLGSLLAPVLATALDPRVVLVGVASVCVGVGAVAASAASYPSVDSSHELRLPAVRPLRGTPGDP